VRTGEYWDHELADLHKRKDELTDEEKKVLEESTSNAPFHYLGSAKIYSRIAKALLEQESRGDQTSL